MGLWITGKIVELMKGEISVYSQLNFGTRFIISIPVESFDVENKNSQLQTKILNLNSKNYRQKNPKALLFMKDKIMKNLFSK